MRQSAYLYAVDITYASRPVCQMWMPQPKSDMIDVHVCRSFLLYRISIDSLLRCSWFTARFPQRLRILLQPLLRFPH